MKGDLLVQQAEGAPNEQSIGDFPLENGEPAGADLLTEVDPEQYRGLGGAACLLRGVTDVDDDTYKPVE